MATITSAGAGNWHNGATWVGGSAPTANDDAVLIHAIVVQSGQTNVCKSCTVDGSGKISFGSGSTLTFTDASGAYLKINDDSLGIDSDGTLAAPVILKSASTNPTNKWYIVVEDQTTIPDSRTMDMRYTECRGNTWCLGNDTYYIRCNDGTSASGTMTHATPPIGQPQLTIHYCDGRTSSRVYQTGVHAGACTVSGTIPISSYAFQTISNLIESGQRLSFFSQYVHVPTCRIERPSFTPTGAGFMDFNITLVVDK